MSADTNAPDPEDNIRRQAEEGRQGAIWDLVGALSVPKRSVAAWQRVGPRVTADASCQVPTIPRWWSTRRVGVAIAAIFLVGLAIGLRDVSLERLSSLRPGREYATTAGQRMSITLTDGTQVTLGPASQLRLAAGHRRNVREVELDGEAYFTVVHDIAHPFAVRARGVLTRDVGTAFDVRAYPEDAGLRVAVAEGAVMVGGRPLRAGDVAHVSPDGVIVDHVGDVGAYSVWRQGTLVFEETPLREVVREVGRAFGVSITITDSALLDKHITGTLSNRPLDLMLDAVTQAVGATYEHTAQGIVIRPGAASMRGRRASPPPPLTTARMTTSMTTDHE